MKQSQLCGWKYSSEQISLQVGKTWSLTKRQQTEPNVASLRVGPSALRHHRKRDQPGSKRRIKPASRKPPIATTWDFEQAKNTQFRYQACEQETTHCNNRSSSALRQSHFLVSSLRAGNHPLQPGQVLLVTIGQALCIKPASRKPPIATAVNRERWLEIMGYQACEQETTHCDSGTTGQ